VAIGSVGLSPAAVWQVVINHLLRHPADSVADEIVWQIRLPRVLLAAVVGAALTTAGTVVQALVRNALADPYLLGVSSGASVGATAVLLFGAFASLGSGRFRSAACSAPSARRPRCSSCPAPAVSWPRPS
jgi:iron complex transport system permease protein